MKFNIDKVLKEYEDEYINLLCKERMLPDIRDGLRIVQRRILWAMYKLLKQKNKYIKSANIVGETIKYHPHGDQSIYSSLANMINSPNETFTELVKGKGNWGLKKGLTLVGPAAMRYTEAKFGDFYKIYLRFMTKSKLILGETNEEEPEYIPVPIPYSLLYGFQGMVKNVGVSQIYPFRYEDLVIRLYLLVKQKEKFSNTKLEELLDGKTMDNFYPLPFFGDLEIETEDIKSIYEKGTGSFSILPKLFIDQKKGKITILDTYEGIKINKVFESFGKNKKFEKIGGLKVRDLSKGSELKIEVHFHNKFMKAASIDFIGLTKLLKQKLTANLKYNILVYRGLNDYPVIGVDEWLLYTYENYKNYHKKEIYEKIKQLQDKLLRQLLIKFLQPYIKQFLSEIENMTTVPKSKINKFITMCKNLKPKYKDEISYILNNTSIMKLLQIRNEIPETLNEIKKTEKLLTTIHRDSFNYILKGGNK